MPPLAAAHAAPVSLPRRELLGGAAGLAAAAFLPPHPQPARAVESLPLVPRGAPLGAARVTPSAVIKGCWQLSGSHRGDAASDRTGRDSAVADFSAFEAAGIDSFDMGPEACGYGPAELVVGDYLRTRPAGAPAPVLLSKLCAVGGEQSGRPAELREWVRGRVSRACTRLGAAQLDLAQIYWNDYAYGDGLVTAALVATEEAAAGRGVRAVGYTNMNTETLQRLRAAGAEVASHQIQFSLLDRRPLRLQTDWCLESGCRLLPYGVLAGGLLSDRYLGAAADSVQLDTASKGKYASVLRRAGGWPWFQRLLAALRAVGDARGGQSISNVAARWVLQQPAVGSVILGARNAAHVDDHRRLFSFQLSPEDLAAIDEVLREGVQAKGASAAGSQPAATDPSRAFSGDTYDWERGGVF